MSYTIQGQEGSFKTLREVLAAIHSAGQYPATFTDGREVSGTISGPVAKSKAPRRAARKVELVERTDADVQYTHEVVIAAAKVWVDESGAARVPSKGGAVHTKLTIIPKEETKTMECKTCGSGMTKFRGEMICSSAKCPTNPQPAKKAAPKKAAPKKTLADKIDAAVQKDALAKKATKKHPTVEVRERQEKISKLADDRIAEITAEKTKAERTISPRQIKEMKQKTAAKKAAKAPTQEAPAVEIRDEQAAVVVTEQPRRTREDWLADMVTELRPLFLTKTKMHLPEKIRVSCGWPSRSAMGGSKRRIGECWTPEASSDKTTEIFVSPILAKGPEVADVLAHELVHAAVGVEAGHGPVFRKVAVALGLEGKMTSTKAGDELRKWLDEACAKIGEYPHATLDMSQRKKDTTRLIKVVCPNSECDYFTENEKPYVVRMSATALEYGAPACGCCNDRMVIDEKQTTPKKAKAASGECPDCGTELEHDGCPLCSEDAARTESRMHGDD